jgi:predicted ATPase
MSIALQRITLKGFKTIRELNGFEPGAMNVLIGPNGAGKSNFISFFRLLSWMLTPPGQLQTHVAMLGGANALLYKGAQITREIQAELTFRSESGENEYSFWLSYAAGDTFVFTNECFRFSRSGFGSKAPWCSLDSGHKEAQIIGKAELGDQTARVILSLMRQCGVHQFHNTSDTARMRQKWNVHDNRWLKEDGANLAPVLLRIKEEEPGYYYRIVENLRLILPFFADFELNPDKFGSMILQWREIDNDMIFGAPQAADGMLRCIALVTLLAQPESSVPNILVLDEPELGLHPFAISVIAGLLKSLSQKKQVFVATQSTSLLDHFEPEDIVVLNRRKGESQFCKFRREQLESWLDEYALSELWEKNVLTGRP